MTKKDLKKLIRECYNEVVNEQEEMDSAPMNTEVEPTAPHSETEPSDSESREVQLARQLKALAIELLSIHGITDDENQSEEPEAGEEAGAPEAPEAPEDEEAKIDESKKKITGYKKQ